MIGEQRTMQAVYLLTHEGQQASVRALCRHLELTESTVRQGVATCIARGFLQRVEGAGRTPARFLLTESGTANLIVPQRSGPEFYGKNL
jgi:predicted ArsR family transcriptional regulator